MLQDKLFNLGDRIAGVDEAGRGPLAGPVVAAAVILDGAAPIDGIADSKMLTARRRETLAGEIRRRALAWSVGCASSAEIDAINILAATMLAMERAVFALDPLPTGVLVDGNRLPDLRRGAAVINGEAVVRGDATVAAIGAASILAKTARDAIMRDLDAAYPQYGFAQHKGYGTRLHLQLLKEHGPCDEHRRTFAPVRDVA